MKQVLVLATFMGLTIFTYAQKGLRLNVIGAYAFDDSYEVFQDANTYYNGTVKGGFQYGGSIEYLPSAYGSIELSYVGQSTTSPANFKFGQIGPKHEDFNVTLNYILLGGNGYFPYDSKKIQGYAGMFGGVVFAGVESPSTGNSGDNTSFAWGGKLGANIWVSEKIGIKVQALLLSSSRVTGGDTYWSWYGPIYLNTYSTLWQFSLGGGLTFKLGQ